MKLAPREADRADRNIPVTELTLCDIDKMLEVMYLNNRQIDERFSRHDRCFAVMQDQSISSYFWVQNAIRELPELHLKFNLDRDQVWLYNAVTIRRARGRGLCANTVRHIAETLEGEGIEEMFVDAEHANEASLRSLTRAGFVKIALIRLKSVLRQKRYYVRIFDKSTWYKLAQNIQDFDPSRIVVENCS